MKNEFWTNDDIKKLYYDRLMNKPYKIIAKELNRTEESCMSKFRKTDFSKLGIIDDDLEIEKSEKLEKFKTTQSNSISNKLEQFKLQTDAIIDIIDKKVSSLPTVQRPIYRPNGKYVKKEHTEDVGLLLSDLHIGEEYTYEDTSGISEYNINVFKKRLDNLKTAVADIVDMHSLMYKLPTLHIMCLGDIVAGMNAAGAWSPLYITSPIVDQLFDGFDAISSIINYWLGLFDEIHFYGIIGNHGRSAPLGIQKDHDNWDYVCYKFLEKMFAKNDRVKFHVPKSWFIMETIRNHNFLMIHGDNIKSGTMPLKNLAVFEQKMMQILRKSPDYTVSGHYHNTMEMSSNSGKLIMNGSFVGSDVYSLKTCHAGSKPEQKLFGISDRHGITWTYNVNLDIPRGEAK